MPQVLHSIGQLNHSVYKIFHQQTITVYTFCMRVYALNFQRGLKSGEKTSWQFYQTAPRACQAKSMRQISS